MKEYITTAVKKNGIYKHFNINPTTASMYGCDIKDIINVKCIILNTSIFDINTSDKKTDYWGMIDNNRISIIQDAPFLFNMCFPYGVLAQENKFPGSCVNLKIEEI